MYMISATDFQFSDLHFKLAVCTYVQTLRSTTHMTKSIRITTFLVRILLTFLKISLLIVKADEQRILVKCEHNSWQKKQLKFAID